MSLMLQIANTRLWRELSNGFSSIPVQVWLILLLIVTAIAGWFYARMLFERARGLQIREAVSKQSVSKSSLPMRLTSALGGFLFFPKSAIGTSRRHHFCRSDSNGETWFFDFDVQVSEGDSSTRVSHSTLLLVPTGVWPEFVIARRGMTGSRLISNSDPAISVGGYDLFLKPSDVMPKEFAAELLNAASEIDATVGVQIECIGRHVLVRLVRNRFDFRLQDLWGFWGISNRLDPSRVNATLDFGDRLRELGKRSLELQRHSQPPARSQAPFDQPIQPPSSFAPGCGQPASQFAGSPIDLPMQAHRPDPGQASFEVLPDETNLSTTGFEDVEEVSLHFHVASAGTDPGESKSPIDFAIPADESFEAEPARVQITLDPVSDAPSDEQDLLVAEIARPAPSTVSVVPSQFPDAVPVDQVASTNLASPSPFAGSESAEAMSVVSGSGQQEQLVGQVRPRNNSYTVYEILTMLIGWVLGLSGAAACATVMLSLDGSFGSLDWVTAFVCGIGAAIAGGVGGLFSLSFVGKSQSIVTESSWKGSEPERIGTFAGLLLGVLAAIFTLEGWLAAGFIGALGGGASVLFMATPIWLRVIVLGLLVPLGAGVAAVTMVKVVSGEVQSGTN